MEEWTDIIELANAGISHTDAIIQFVSNQRGIESECHNCQGSNFIPSRTSFRSDPSALVDKRHEYTVSSPA